MYSSFLSLTVEKYYFFLLPIIPINFPIIPINFLLSLLISDYPFWVGRAPERLSEPGRTERKGAQVLKWPTDSILILGRSIGWVVEVAAKTKEYGERNQRTVDKSTKRILRHAQSEVVVFFFVCLDFFVSTI